MQNTGTNTRPIKNKPLSGDSERAGKSESAARRFAQQNGWIIGGEQSFSSWMRQRGWHKTDSTKLGRWVQEDQNA